MKRRDFLKVTAAGSVLMGAPGWVLGCRGEYGSQNIDPLHIAESAGAWIRAGGREARGGLTWPMVPGDGEGAALNLYSGTPGIVLFLLELHHATGDPTYLEEARKGAQMLQNAYLQGGEWAEAAGSRADDPSLSGAGLYTGRAGAAFAVAETSLVSEDDALRSAAELLFKGLTTGASSVGSGLAWFDDSPDAASYDIISGSAGIGLSLLYASEKLGLSSVAEVAVEAGRYLLTRARSGEVGVKWPMSEDYPRLMPNFSHGTAGVAYFLARLAEETGDQEFLDSAVQGARYLQEVSRCKEDGCLVFHHEPQGEDLFYLGWCHGPPGTVRLYQQLAQVTGEGSWAEWVVRGAEGIRNLGIPENRAEGYWNNVSQCCGDAGVGDFFLSLSAATGVGEYGDFARHLGDYLLGEGIEEDRGIRWPQAEHRTQPDLLQAQTGWMQGASGIGAFFLKLDGAVKGRAPRVRFPDSPWLT